MSSGNDNVKMGCSSDNDGRDARLPIHSQQTPTDAAHEVSARGHTGGARSREALRGRLKGVT